MVVNNNQNKTPPIQYISEKYITIQLWNMGTQCK